MPKPDATLCPGCPILPAAIQSITAVTEIARIAGRLARDVKTLAGMVRPEHAQKAAMMSQAAADQTLRLLEELPDAESLGLAGFLDGLADDAGDDAGD